MPSISPSTTGSTVYTAAGSKGLVADLSLDIPTTPPFPVIEVRFPSAASGVQVTLVKGAASLALLPGPINDTTTFAGRRIVASASPAGSDTLLTCEIRATAAAASNEAWVVRASSTAAQTWQLTQVDNVPGDLTVTRIMCDPVAAFTISAPSLAGGTVKEKDAVTLTASPATGTAAAPTVVGGPAPSVSYSWTKTGKIAVTEFPACSASQTLPFSAPGVYGPKSIDLALAVWFEGGCPGPVGFLNTTAAAQTLTIEPRPQHLALVLDRSGSMSGARWENAKTAARILAHLFVALRTSVHSADRIEEIVFEDTRCSWQATPDPIIGAVLGPSSVGAADGAICGVNFGPAGQCTPIADGLLRAMDDLAKLGVANDPRFTVVLLTDGYENSGAVKVDPNTPSPSSVQTFATARETGLARHSVNTRMSLYTIGLGPTVQEDVLDALAVPDGYRHVLDVNQIGDAMAQMVSFSQAAQRVTPEPATGGATERFVKLDPGVSRLAVAVEWTNQTDTIQVAWRKQDGTGGFTNVATTVKQCPTNGFVSVDVAGLFGGDETAVPGTEWRIVHANAAGTAQPLPDADLLVFVDLQVRADIVFEREQYRTGDPMVVTARLRDGDDPITKATVTVELARPGEGLGTFLATNGAGYKPTQPSGPDPNAPKAQMIADLLGRPGPDGPDVEGGVGLPIVQPAAIFEDGSNRLFDDGTHHDGQAGDGNYANRYVNVDKEGSYTWRFFITGELAGGAVFSRVITVSKWVGIKVDPGASQVLTAVTPGPGTQLTQVTVYPKDRNGEFLGPFRADEVRFKSSSCPFQRDERETVPDGVVYRQKDGGILISRYDGGYTRVVECPEGGGTTVSIIVQGQELGPVTTGEPGQPGCGCLPGAKGLAALLKRGTRP